MKRKRALTPAAIDTLSSGMIHDPAMPGLYLYVLPSGKKRWAYRRRLPRSRPVVTLRLGPYPAFSIAEAREWAASLNQRLERRIDPRDAMRAMKAREAMTVARAHELYMKAVGEGRGSSAKRPNKPRTIAEKLEIYNRDIGPKIGWKSIYEVTEGDLVRLVNNKGRTARIRANRLAAELRVFFGWAASLRGDEIGLERDPSTRLGDLRFAETPRARHLSLEEIGWFLAGVAREEDPVFRRGMLMWLLSAARMGEVVRARTSEVEGGLWTIPAERVKNGSAHRIALGPWGQALMRWPGEWLFPAMRVAGPRTQGWYKAKDNVHRRMEKLAGHAIERFTPHDFRRTARSNTKRLNFDYETGEAILNHLKQGLERTYDRYDLEREKRAFFLTWEAEIAAIGRKAGLEAALGIPPRPVYDRLLGACEDGHNPRPGAPSYGAAAEIAEPDRGRDPSNVVSLSAARARRLASSAPPTSSSP